MLSLAQSLRAEAGRIAAEAVKLPFGKERAALFAYCTGLQDAARSIDYGYLAQGEAIAKVLAAADRA